MCFWSQLTRVIWPNANWQTWQILQNKPTSNCLRSCANPWGFARVKRSILETVARCSLANCASLVGWDEYNEFHGNRVRSFLLHQSPLASVFTIPRHVL